MRRTLLLACVAVLTGLAGCGEYDPGDILGGASGAGGSGPSAQRIDAMKAIGRAMHNYHDTHKTAPPAATRGPDGEPLLSWRVALLPFLSDTDGQPLRGLYDQFHHDEPWDSQHNFQLLKKMPKIYTSGGGRTEGTTSLMVFTGPGTPFGGAEAPRFARITDGTSNTIFCVEVGPDKAVPWTKPDDLPFDFDDPVGSLGKIDAETFAALHWDGSVRPTPKDIHPESLRRLVYHRDGSILVGPTTEDPGGPPVARPADPTEEPPAQAGGTQSSPFGSPARPEPSAPFQGKLPTAERPQAQPAEQPQAQPAETPFGAPPEKAASDVPPAQPQPAGKPKTVPDPFAPAQPAAQPATKSEAVPDPFAPTSTPSQPPAAEKPKAGATPQSVPDPFAPAQPSAKSEAVPDPFAPTPASSQSQATEMPEADATSPAVPDPFAPTEPAAQPQATEQPQAQPAEAQSDATSQPVSNPFAPTEPSGQAQPAEQPAAQPADATSQPVSNPFAPTEPSGQAQPAETEGTASQPAPSPFIPREPSGKAQATAGAQPGTTFPPEKPGDTPLVGGPAGAPFRLTDPQGRPVIGVRYRVGAWAKQERVARLEPLFGGEPPMPGYETVMAREGYAVGALRVDAGEIVHAVEVIFMRVQGDRLIRKDWYKSDWIGVPAGSKPHTLGGSGARVLGIYGRRTIILDAVGLVLDES